MKDGYHFRSSLFAVEPGEDEETNPRCYGRQLALWLKEELAVAGYDTEVVAEDWGWCVLCQRKPFLLWVGCGNVRDPDRAAPDDPPPSAADMIWHCFVEAELPPFARLFKRIEASGSLDKLDADLRAILTTEAGIEIVPEP
jgi:hypothetical protein